MKFVSVAVAVCVLLCTSCAPRVPANSFRVVPATPSYSLRSPDSLAAPFSEILRRYNGFEPDLDWIDLRPGMELRIENSYYQPGMSRRGINGFLGTEIARYQMRPRAGLQLLSVQSMKDRPSEQLPVQQLIPAFAMHSHCYRFYYEILFLGSGTTRGSVLLSANTSNDLLRLARGLLSDPDLVCGESSRNCTVFPEACSVSIEMEIVVNDTPRNVIWGNLLSSIVGNSHHVELWRMYHGRLLPVQFDPADNNVLRLPLLPGDHVKWN